MPLHPNEIENGVLSSGKQNGNYCMEKPCGSFYLQMIHWFDYYLHMYQDWNWLVNFRTKDVFKASQFKNFSQRFSVIFQQYGFTEGDAIFAYVGNHNLLYPAFGGAWILGGIVSSGDVSLDYTSMASQIIEIGAKIVLCTPDVHKAVSSAVRTAEGVVKYKIALFSFGSLHESDYTCKDIISMLNETNTDEAPTPTRFDDKKLDTETAIVFWTSGTTGSPRGICHSHTSAWNWGGFSNYFITEHSNLVTTTCFFHVGGFFTGVNACRKHSSYYHMNGDGLTLETILDAVSESQSKVLYLGTHHYVKLSKSQQFLNYDAEKLSSLQVIIPTGATIPDACIESYKTKLPNFVGIWNGYGLTETGMLIVNNNSMSLGKILPGVQVKIVNTETERVCKCEVVGEIRVKNQYMTVGYTTNKESLGESLDEDGFYKTGDLGYYDEEIDIYYVDRMKALIKYKNNHVSPNEIENILHEHPAVKDCFVFGKKCDEVQELVSAIVVTCPSIQVDENELIAFVNQRVIDYKKIRGGIAFVVSIPRNDVGKLLRRKLTKWADAIVTGSA